MRPLLDGWAIIAFIFWMAFCWTLCYRRMFWGSLAKNITTSLFFACLGITLIVLASRPWVNAIHLVGRPSKYNSEILHLVGSMCLALSLSVRIFLQPNPMPNPRILVSDENVPSLTYTTHIVDDVRLREGDIVILTNQNLARNNGPWEVRKKAWRRPESNPTGSRTFGSWLVANCGQKFANTLWIGSLCRNDIVGEGELDWKQINPDSRIRTFVSLDIPCNVGEAAKFLLKVGVLPYQITSDTQEGVVKQLQEGGHISPTAVGILLHKPDAARNDSNWGPRVRAAMRLLIHSGEFDYAHEAYESAVLNGFEHRMTEEEVRVDLETRVRNEGGAPVSPTRFEREDVI